jgi:leader peptidase (prepilin peptidase)/N-methyltransferase
MNHWLALKRHCSEQEQSLHQRKRILPASISVALRYGLWGGAALCAVVASVLMAPEPSGLLGGGLALAMMTIAAIDARYFLIPDELVLTGLALGLIKAALAPGLAPANIAIPVLRAVVLAGLFLTFRVGYRFIRRREGLGLGDVKLAAVGGLWLGWMSAAIALEIAALSALASVLIGVLRGRSFTGTTRLPFGLFFAPAIWVTWLLAEITAQFHG